MGSPLARIIFMCLVAFILATSTPDNDQVPNSSTGNADINDPLWTKGTEDLRHMPKTEQKASTGKQNENKAATTESNPSTESEGKDSEVTISEGYNVGSDNVGYGGTDLELCDCPYIRVNFTCVCSNLNGIIERKSTDADIGSGTVQLEYSIHTDVPGKIAVFFKAEDYPKPSSLCKLTVGDTEISSAGSLQEVNVLYTDTDVPIKVNGYFLKGMCTYTLQYYTYVFTTNITILNSTEGYLTAPVDETGMYPYRPNTEILWILQPDILVSEFNFTFDYLDLGLPENKIHGNNKLNFSSGDFLVIGPGEDLLQGSDLMFYGIRESGNFKKVVTIGGSSHVFFSSTVSMFNATGFNISYVATVVEQTTTPVPVTTVNPPAPDDKQTTYLASIEGASKDKATINKTIENFQDAMVNMSSEYSKMKQWETRDPITKESILVYEAMTCNTLRCNPECVAFNFSVVAVDANDSWIFTETVLEDMLFTPELQYALSAIGKDCTVCDENRSLNLGLYIGIPVGIVVFALIVSTFLWYLGSRSNLEASRRKYEQEIADRRDDNRRRSSGDVSILGVGGSIASKGSLSSGRFTMPFSMAKRDIDIMQEEDGEDTVDMSDFKEYDPDLGRVDPAEFGISREFLSEGQGMSSQFTNYGFVDDEGGENRTIFHRGHSIATTAGTDSEDSDGGAVSFSGTTNRRSKSPPTATFQATADVHMADEGPIYVDEGTGETAL